MAVPSLLSRKLREALGPEAAEDLVTWMDEVGSQREDLRAIRADAAQLRQEILAALEASEKRMLERIHGVESRLGERLGEQIHSLDRRIGDVKADLMKWSFVFWVGAVAAIAALAGVLRH